MAVADAEHLLAVNFVAAALLPQLGRLDGRHQKLESPGAVLLFAHDLLDLLEDGKTQGKPRVDAGAGLADETGSKHEPVRDELGLFRIVAEKRKEVPAEAHGHHLLEVWGGRAVAAAVVDICMGFGE